MNFLKKFFGTSATDEIALIPSGKLYLARPPKSPKGELECLYNDAYASIRKTTSKFIYQLCVTRVYQEGELDLNGSDGFGDSDDSDEFEDHDTKHSITDITGASQSTDEWSFILTEELDILILQKLDGFKYFSWRDLNGDLGDRFEFVIDEEVKNKQIEKFTEAIYKCIYENKYCVEAPESFANVNFEEDMFSGPSKSAFEALESDLHGYKENQPIGDFIGKQTSFSPAENPDDVESVLSAESDKYEDALSELSTPNQNSALTCKEISDLGNCVTSFECDSFQIMLFDPVEERFAKIDDTSKVFLKIIDMKNWSYVLVIASKDLLIDFNCVISKELSPSFDYDELKFSFNTYNAHGDDLIAYSWCMKFDTLEIMETFQLEFMKSMWQSIHKEIWGSISNCEHDYIIDAFSKMSIKDNKHKQVLEEYATIPDEASGSDDDFDSEEELEYNSSDHIRQDSSHFDNSTQEKNTNLVVGYANDRTYVIRSNNIGVFSEGEENLQFQTTIPHIKDLSGKPFNPDQIMLHMRDNAMVMTNNNNNDSQNNILYKMDLNRGQIVEEWDVDRDVSVKAFAPNTKFSPLTQEQTFTAASSNKLFQVDPRLQGYKMVRNFDDLSVSILKYSCIATTEDGYLAAGSSDGTIRLYDKIDKRAKCLIPSLGDPIIGIDVSKDGTWLLATCKTYLLLINTKIGHGQRNEGALGYKKPFDADKKPTPRRLAIFPEHLAYMSMELGKDPLNFSKAYFNTGIDKAETTIVTSTGPYVITWSLKKVLSNNNECPYLIRKYNGKVVADNFKFGSNNEVVMALQNDVSIVKKKSLYEANKNSIYF